MPELATLKELYPNQTSNELAILMNRTKRSVKEMAKKHGIKKNADFLSKAIKQNWQLRKAQ